MRTHFLHELKLPGNEKVETLMPRLDLYDVNVVQGIRYQRRDQGDSTLDLTLCRQGSDSAWQLDLRCELVSLLRIDLDKPVFYVSELEVEDFTESQHELGRFRIMSYFDRSLEIVCKHLLILGFQNVGAHRD